jgi:hypothetical protein
MGLKPKDEASPRATERKKNVRSERMEEEKGGLDFVLAAEPVAHRYCWNKTQHLAHEPLRMTWYKHGTAMVMSRKFGQKIL